MGKLWTVHWVSGALEVPVGTHPVLDEWRDLVEREEAYGLEPGDPFMVDPDYRADARLTRFFSRSSFAHLAKATKRSYTTDYRVFFNFLWQRGKNWDAATADDLLGFVRRLRPRLSAPTDRTPFVRGLVSARTDRSRSLAPEGHGWAFLGPCRSWPLRRRRSRWSARSEAEDERPGGAASRGHTRLRGRPRCGQN